MPHLSLWSDSEAGTRKAIFWLLKSRTVTILLGHPPLRLLQVPGESAGGASVADGTLVAGQVGGLQAPVDAGQAC